MSNLILSQETNITFEILNIYIWHVLQIDLIEQLI